MSGDCLVVLWCRVTNNVTFKKKYLMTIVYCGTTAKKVLHNATNAKTTKGISKLHSKSHFPVTTFEGTLPLELTHLQS